MQSSVKETYLRVLTGLTSVIGREPVYSRWCKQRQWPISTVPSLGLPDVTKTCTMKIYATLATLIDALVPVT